MNSDYTMIPVTEDVNELAPSPAEAYSREFTVATSYVDAPAIYLSEKSIHY